MTSRLRLWVLLWTCFLVYVSCTPTPSSGGTKPGKARISQKVLYRNMSLEDVPTEIRPGIILSNHTNHLRYGYFIGRPVDRMFRGPLGSWVKKTFFIHIVAKIPFLLHWAIVISEEPPLQFTATGELPRGGSIVFHPDDGLIYELCNNQTTHLISLVVRSWATYPYRQGYVKYLGSLNRTDSELVTIGRAYIRHVGQGEFHPFYRNCQHFTTWYSKELWPKSTTSTRADQLFGKLLWWFRDWKKTARWAGEKISQWTGHKVTQTEEVDSSAKFVGVHELTSCDWKCAEDDEIPA